MIITVSNLREQSCEKLYCQTNAHVSHSQQTTLWSHDPWRRPSTNTFYE